MLTLCEIHNEPENHCISFKLKEIVKSDYKQNCKIVKVIIYGVENGIVINNHAYYATDVELSEIVTLDNRRNLFLYDRDKIKKEANDRVVILKVKRVMAVAICGLCLKNMLAYANNQYLPQYNEWSLTL